MNHMKFVSAYVREQRRYSKKELKNLFAYDEQEIEQFIRKMKTYGILKTVKNNTEQLELSDLMDEHIEIADETIGNNKVLYVFTYVGVLTYGNRIIKVYPKYLLSANDPLSEMKQVMKVLEKYNNSQEQIINLFNNDGENLSFNLLPIILFLLNDYYEYGVYNNSESIIEVNGEGAILWEKTINEGLPFIRDNSPYYIELYTEKTIDDDMDFFKRLHECILTECSQQLHNSKLEDLFEMVSVELSEERIEDFGDTEYILDRIQAELSIQFNTRKQILLKTMSIYISHNRKMLDENEGISMYGTTSFNMVWEKMCSEVFDNQLRTPLGRLVLPVPLNGYDEKKALIDIIEKPIWEVEDTTKISKRTLEPDIVTISQFNGESQLTILDAKYYNLQLEKEKPLIGNPGIGDITKQYLYQLAYKKFIELHKFMKVRNCFLMPTEQSEIIKKGTVSLAMFKLLEDLKLESIQIRLVPAHMVSEHYLKNKKISIEQLEL